MTGLVLPEIGSASSNKSDSVSQPITATPVVAPAQDKASQKASKGFITGFGGELGETDGSFATGVSQAIIGENETLSEELQRQKELIQYFQELEIGDAQTHADALVAIKKQQANEERRMQSEMLSASADFFGASADLIDAFAGESSGAYKALFAVSKGFAIANAALNLNSAIMQALADPTALTPQQKFANYAAIASAGTSLISNITSASFSGGRERGIAAGPVSAGGLYSVGENNKPEVFVPNGIAMIPGSNGKVFNQDQLGQINGGGGGNTMNVNQNITVTGTGDQDLIRAMSQAAERGAKMAEQNFVSQMSNKEGPSYNATSANYGEGKTNGRQI